MNVNIVCDYAAVYSGNFISSILFFADSVRSNNNIVFLFPMEAKERKWVDHIQKQGYEIYFFSRRKSQFIKDVRKVAKITKANLVYFHFVSPALGKAAFIFKNVRLCFHIHSDFNGGKKPKLFKRLKDNFFDRYINRKSIYIFVSADLCFKSLAPVKLFIPNALARKIDGIIKMSDEEHKEINNSFKGVDFSKPCFLAFAWSPYIKGIDVLCKAFNSFSRKHPSYLFLVYRKDGGKEELLSFLKKNQIVLNNIILIPPVEDVALYYSKCSCFVSSSRSEGFSYSVLEALSFGKKVILSDIPGTSWAKKFSNVFVFKNEEIAALEESLLLSTKKQINEDEAANKELLEQYNIDIWVSSIKKFLCEQGVNL